MGPCELAQRRTVFLPHIPAGALQRLQAAGVKTLEFPEPVWDAMGSASAEVLDSYMDDELYAQIRGSVNESMKASSGWLVKSEGIYRSHRDRILG